MVDATNLSQATSERSDSDVGTKRFLRWVQLPVGAAAITATVTHLVVRFLEPFLGNDCWQGAICPAAFHNRVNADQVASIAAIFALAVVLAYGIGRQARTN